MTITDAAHDQYYRGPALRAWQRNALEAWEDNSRRGVVEAITGTGKSIVGVRAIRDVIALGGQALVLVPTQALLDQWFAVLRVNLSGVDIGRVSGQHKDRFLNKDVLIATVQSVSRTPISPTSLGLLVADEVHRYGSEKFSQALHAGFEWRLGLTATLERLDDGVSQVLKPYFRGTVYRYDYAQAIHDDVVAPFHLLMVGVEFSELERARFDEATLRASDVGQELRTRYSYPPLWADFFYEVQRTLQLDRRDDEFWLCNNYMQAFSERRTLMAEARAKQTFVEALAPLLTGKTGLLFFTETKDSAARLAYIVNKHLPAFPLTSDSNQDERARVLRQFRAGQIGALCTPRILDEGVDVPAANLAIIVAASSTRRQMIQRMGRVIRLKKDGGSAGIVFLYVKGTPEDPDTGGHEAFLDTVMPHARSTTIIDASCKVEVQDWVERYRGL